MSGRLGGLFRRGPKEATPPPFTLELPARWAGGYGPAAFLEAMVKFARDVPECSDRAFDQLRRTKGIEEAQYLAAAACGPDATVSVNAEEVPSELPVDDALLEGFVASNVDDLAARDDLIEGPTVSTVDTPYRGRVLRWSWSFEGMPPDSFSMYVFPSHGRLWTITCSSPAASADANDAAFREIVSSFRLLDAEPIP